MQYHHKRTTCRLCGGYNLELMVPIPSTPLGGSFVSKDALGIEQDTYPLDMHQCTDCGHVQLLDVVDPQLIFSNFSYFSGQTSLIHHLERLANDIIEERNMKEGSFVVDVGSNDGAFLNFLQKRGIRVLGVDPAKNVAEYANSKGIETLAEMFDEDIALKIRSEYGPAQLVTALNVFAHTDDMTGMAAGVRSILDEDGLFVFEVSYLVDVVDKMLLGTILHEHVCYHTIKPLIPFLRRHGLEIIDVERVQVQGGSLVCTAQVAGANRRISEAVGELIALEGERGVYEASFLDSFAKSLGAIRAEISQLVQDLNGQGKSIAAFGAARGGTLLTYLFGLGEAIDYIVDDDPAKQGLYSPGYHIPVLPTKTIYERKPDYVVILAWVHSDAIIANNKEYLDGGGYFVTFFPEVKVIGKNTTQEVEKHFDFRV